MAGPSLFTSDKKNNNNPYDPAITAGAPSSYYGQSERANQNNKIRVVIRMRPYLEGEHEILASQPDVLAGGSMQLQASSNAVK